MNINSGTRLTILICCGDAIRRLCNFWRLNIFSSVNVISLRSRRMCAIHISNNNFKLPLIKVHMPYESQDDTTDDFADQLFIIETLINDSSDFHIIVGQCQR